MTFPGQNIVQRPEFITMTRGTKKKARLLWVPLLLTYSYFKLTKSHFPSTFQGATRMATLTSHPSVACPMREALGTFLVCGFRFFAVSVFFERVIASIFQFLSVSPRPSSIRNQAWINVSAIFYLVYLTLTIWVTYNLGVSLSMFYFLAVFAVAWIAD